MDYNFGSKKVHDPEANAHHFASGSKAFPTTLLSPTFQCVTRKFKYTPRQVLLLESVFLRPEELTHSSLMTVHIHQPNQLIRSFGSLGLGTWTFMLRPSKEIVANIQSIEIGINSIQVLTKRHNAKKRCNRNLLDDDTQWMKATSSTTGCVPIFWKRFLKLWKEESGLSFCKTYEDYQIIDYHMQNRWNVTMQYDPPCKKMTVSSNAIVGQKLFSYHLQATLSLH